MWEYSDKVKEHFTNPKNVGEIEDASAIGVAGSLQCGDQLKLYLKIEKGIIKDAKFQTFGCGSAVAASSMLTEMVIGKTVDEAKEITNKQIAEMLGGLPAQKMHCSVMGREALEDALERWEGIDSSKKEKKIICKCYNVAQDEIKKAVQKGARTFDEVAEITSAGKGCKRCRERLENVLKTELNQIK